MCRRGARVFGGVCEAEPRFHQEHSFDRRCVSKESIKGSNRNEPTFCYTMRHMHASRRSIGLSMGWKRIPEPFLRSRGSLVRPGRFTGCAQSTERRSDGASDASSSTFERALHVASTASDGLSHVVELLFERVKRLDERLEAMESDLIESQRAKVELESKLDILRQERLREQEEWMQKESEMVSKMEQLQNDSVQLQEMLAREKENTNTVEKARSASVREVSRVLARMRDMDFSWREKEADLLKRIEDSEGLLGAVMAASSSVKDVPPGDSRTAKELAALQKASVIASHEHFENLERMRLRAEKAEHALEQLASSADTEQKQKNV